MSRHPFITVLTHAALCGCLALLVAGCGGHSSALTAAETQIADLRREKADLTAELEQSKTDNRLLQKQLQTLAAIPPDVRVEELTHVRSIKIDNYTNFYDSNDSGRKETLIVYVTPVDDTADAVKAAGTIDVQLWNLDNPAAAALLAQWTIDNQQLKRLWVSTMFLRSYRLTFETAGIVKDFSVPYTVKVSFTEYLTGKTFSAQHVIKPD